MLSMQCLLRRTPGPTATTQRQIHYELARGLWETWSSYCSSHSTCPRRLNNQGLMRMRQRKKPTHTSSIIGTQQRRRTEVVKSRQHNDTHQSCQTYTLVPIPDIRPPAKNTRPDGNDAAAKSYRACPRPVGNVVQLLLVALYMST